MKTTTLLAKISLVICTLMAVIPGFSQNQGGKKTSQEKRDTSLRLKDYFKNYFPIGVAVTPRVGKGNDTWMIQKHFSSLTAENAMKMGPIHPAENRYNWGDADSILAFAERNGMLLRGHNLCWHNQAPRWMFTNEKGDTVSRDVLLQRLKTHIDSVVGRYKGRIYAWDVVNEAISDKDDEYLRPSPWTRIIGEDFIAQAFRYAHEADPKALLFYNDYNEISAIKRAKMLRMIRSLQKQGVPIHGVGLQAHWAVNEPTEEQLDSTLSEFAATGLKIHITELDISVYPKEHQTRSRQPADADTAFTPQREQAQRDIYSAAFKLFMKYRKSIGSVTFWNVSDRGSWLDNFPVRGRKDYPLLFDRFLQPKNAYWNVVGFGKK